MHSSRLGQGAVVAALLVAFAGGATAKTMIDGHDIKKGSVTGRQVKNGSLRLKDLNAQDRAALHGANGTNGTNAAPGAGGFGPPPPGTTVTGYANYLQPDLAAGQVVRYSVALPFVTVAPLQQLGSLWFQDAPQVTPGYASAGCTGSAAAPTAPAGQLCVYLSGIANVKSASAVPIPGAGIPGTPDDSHGFIVALDANANGAVAFAISWAYTAP